MAGALEHQQMSQLCHCISRPTHTLQTNPKHWTATEWWSVILPISLNMPTLKNRTLPSKQPKGSQVGPIPRQEWKRPKIGRLQAWPSFYIAENIVTPRIRVIPWDEGKARLFGSLQRIHFSDFFPIITPVVREQRGRERSESACECGKERATEKERKEAGLKKMNNILAPPFPYSNTVFHSNTRHSQTSAVGSRLSRNRQ